MCSFAEYVDSPIFQIGKQRNAPLLPCPDKPQQGVVDRKRYTSAPLCAPMRHIAQPTVLICDCRR
jgi:hypothetical protein